MSNAELIEEIVPQKPMFKRDELAEILGVDQQRLASLARQKAGPPMLKIGRACRYPRPGIVNWMLANSMIPTVL